MAAPQVHHLFHAPINDHSFSPDRSTLAVTRGEIIELYQTSGSSYRLADELRGHDKLITGVDIAPGSGKIVTCSQDRNAYVWQPDPATGKWKPTLVLLRLNRAATCVRWSPNEKKFAVGSGARAVAICSYDSDADGSDWWISKHFKKNLRSTITSLAWHPNSVLYACGSTDGQARVVSSWLKGLDAKPEATAWGERLPFGTVCGEFQNTTAAWVNSVAFSPSGATLAFVAHDSSLTVIYPSAPDQPPHAVISVTTQLLPFADLLWLSESEIVCAGYDCGVYRFGGSLDGWQLTGSLEKKAAARGGEAKEESALNLFRSMDLKGRSGSGVDDTKLPTVHQNAIKRIRAYQDAGAQVASISTSGDDGRVVVWTL